MRISGASIDLGPEVAQPRRRARWPGPGRASRRRGAPCSGRASAQAISLVQRGHARRPPSPPAGRCPPPSTSAAIVASVPVTLAARPCVPDATTAHGRRRRRLPPAISAAAIGAEPPDAHEHDERAAGSVASAAQSTSARALPGRSWPVTTVNLRGQAAVRHRARPRRPGTAIAEVMPGTTSNGDAGRAQRLRLLAAAAEHERVAALEAHDESARGARARPASRRLVLRHATAARRLAGVDQQAARRRARSSSGVAGQAVVDDHVGAAHELERRAP